MKIVRTYTVGEEIGSSVSHGLGVLLGIAGLSVLYGTALCWQEQ